jgi:hypothetical protein
MRCDPTERTCNDESVINEWVKDLEAVAWIKFQMIDFAKYGEKPVS